MNPIRQKLEKMFGRKKQRQMTRASTERYSSAYTLATLSDMEPCSDNKFRHSMWVDDNKQNRAASQLNLDAGKQVSKLRRQLQEYKRANKSLEERLQDHQLLEQFYLEQLRDRDETQKELKWRLQVINEQIMSNRLGSLSFRESFSESCCPDRKMLSNDF